MRRRKDACSAEELVAPEPGEPRELSSARHHITQLAREIAHMRHELGKVATQRDATQAELDRRRAVPGQPPRAGLLDKAERLLCRIGVSPPTARK